MDYKSIPESNYLMAMAVMEQTIISLVNTIKAIENDDAKKAANYAKQKLDEVHKAISELSHDCSDCVVDERCKS